MFTLPRHHREEADPAHTLDFFITLFVCRALSILAATLVHDSSGHSMPSQSDPGCFCRGSGKRGSFLHILLRVLLFIFYYILPQTAVASEIVISRRLLL
jgi:hypothetical protein